MNRTSASASTVPESSLLSETCSPPSSSSVSNVKGPPGSSARIRQTPAKDAVAGACAGAIAKTVVAPIERVKLLMQLQFSIDDNTIKGGKTTPANVDTALLSGRRRKCGAWEVAKRVYREQGILAFWRGESADFFGKFNVHPLLGFDFLLSQATHRTLSDRVVPLQ